MLQAVFYEDHHFVSVQKALSPTGSWPWAELRARIKLADGAVDADHRIVAHLRAWSSSVSVVQESAELLPSSDWQTLSCRIDKARAALSQVPFDRSAVNSYELVLRVSAREPGVVWPSEPTIAWVDSFELVELSP